jgi:hypothetical protein
LPLPAGHELLSPLPHVRLTRRKQEECERLTRLSGIGGFEQPIPDETLDPALDRLIEGGKFFLRRRVKFNAPGQDFV